MAILLGKVRDRTEKRRKKERINMDDNSIVLHVLYVNSSERMKESLMISDRSTTF